MPICPICETEYDEETCPVCQEEDWETHPPEADSLDGETPPEVIHKNPFVRAAVRMLMIVGFLALVSLVVFGTDFIMELIQILFSDKA